MFQKPFSDVTIEDIQRLVDDQAPESTTLDFKKEFYDLKVPQSKKELLKDISAFANASGGVLCIGVAEKKGAANELCGFECQNKDALQREIVDAAKNWIEPRLSVSFNWFSISAGRYVLLIQVEQSLLGPHRVIFQNDDAFYLRVSTQNPKMDTNQLRNAFLRTASIYQNIRTFRADRIKLIQSANAPKKLNTETPWLVMHILPEQSFSSKVHYSCEELDRCFHRNFLPNASIAVKRNNLEGIILHSDYSDIGITQSYSQIFRGGMCELYWQGFLEPRARGRENGYVIQDYVFSNLIHCCQEHINALASLGMSGNAWIFLAFHHFKDTCFERNPYNDSSQFCQFDRHVLEFSELEIQVKPEDHETRKTFALSMKPLLDEVWQASGHKRCWLYSEDGAKYLVN